MIWLRYRGVPLLAAGRDCVVYTGGTPRDERSDGSPAEQTHEAMKAEGSDQEKHS